MDESHTFGRSGSLSEAQMRSSRAEKRMGRFFKPTLSGKGTKGATATANSAPQIPLPAKPSSSSAASSTSSSDEMRSRSRTISAAMHKASAGSHSAKKLPGHMHSSSATAGLMPSPRQRPAMMRKLSLSSHPAAMKYTTVADTAAPAPTAVSTTPTVSETAARSANQLPPSAIIAIATKFRFIYRECIFLLGRLGLDQAVTLQMGSFPAFNTILETAQQRNTAAKSTPSAREALDRMLHGLCRALPRTMHELCALIDGLGLSAAKLGSCDSETLRLAYFTLYSLVVEAVGICRVLTQSPLQLRPQPNFTRPPAPNPQYGGQLITSQSRQGSVTAAASVNSTTNETTTTTSSRPPLRVDTTTSSVTAQDPLNVDQLPMVDDGTFFDVLEDAIQALEVVFEQLNDVIVRSGWHKPSPSSQDSDTVANTPILEMAAAPAASLDNSGNIVRDMTTVCVEAMDYIERLESDMAVVRHSNAPELHTKTAIHESANMLLRALIKIETIAKYAVVDVPALREMRTAWSNLISTTVKLTVALEKSQMTLELKKKNEGNAEFMEQPPLSSIPSMANFQSIAAPPQPPASASNTIFSPASKASLLSMEQHISALKASGGGLEDSPLPSPAISTPLAASIGPAAASAVLPGGSGVGLMRGEDAALRLRGPKTARTPQESEESEVRVVL